MTPDPETMAERHAREMGRGPFWTVNRKLIAAALFALAVFAFAWWRAAQGAEPQPPRLPDGSVKADAPQQVIQAEVGHAVETCLESGGIALQTHEWNGRIWWWWWCLALPSEKKI